MSGRHRRGWWKSMGHIERRARGSLWVFRIPLGHCDWVGSGGVRRPRKCNLTSAFRCNQALQQRAEAKAKGTFLIKIHGCGCGCSFILANVRK